MAFPLGNALAAAGLVVGLGFASANANSHTRQTGFQPNPALAHIGSADPAYTTPAALAASAELARPLACGTHVVHFGDPPPTPLKAPPSSTPFLEGTEATLIINGTNPPILVHVGQRFTVHSEVSYAVSPLLSCQQDVLGEIARARTTQDQATAFQALKVGLAEVTFYADVGGNLAGFGGEMLVDVRS